MPLIGTTRVRPTLCEAELCDRLTGHPGRRELGSVVVMAFLGAGLSERPSRAQAVDALASARREVASCRARGESVSQCGLYDNEHQ